MSVDAFNYDRKAAALEWLRTKNFRPPTEEVVYSRPAQVRHLHVVRDETSGEPIKRDRPPLTFEDFHPDPFKNNISPITRVETVPDLPELTEDESFTLIQTARGFKVREISRMRPKMQEIGLKSIYEKYGVDNATHAVSLAVKKGVLIEDIFQNAEGKYDFDFSKVEQLNATQLSILRELGNTEESNSDEAIGNRLPTPINVSNVLNNLYKGYQNLQTRPKAAAFYLLAEKRGLFTNAITDPHQSSRQG